MDDGAIARGRTISAGEILAAARQRAQATRRNYAALAECLFLGRESELVLSDRQRAMLSQMLRQLIGDIDAAVREAFAARLDENGAVSRKALSAIAADNGTLTYTIMLEKGLLRDMDLIEAAVHRLSRHQLESARRASGRDDRGEGAAPESARHFLDLPIVENSLLERRIAAYIVDRSRHLDTYGSPVLLPGGMDGQLLQRLYWRMAAVLRALLIEEWPAEPRMLDSLIEAATLDTLRNAAAAAAVPSCATDAAASLDAAGLLTGEVAVRVLQAGEVPLFEAGLARLTGLRPVLLRRLVYEASGTAIAVLARATGMPKETATSLHALTREARAGLERRAGDEGPDVAAVYGALSTEEAERVRAYWTRDPAFIHALWELDSGRVAPAAPTPYY